MSDITALEALNLVEVQTKTNMLECPECGMMCNGATGLGVHRSVKHGYRGPKKNRKPKVRLTKVMNTKPVSKPDWSTREVFDAVVSLLYPGSTMPVGALPILLDWRDDTERMLRRLEDL